MKLFKEDGGGVIVFGTESNLGDEINNKSTSLFVPDGYRVKAYEHEGFNGDHITYLSGSHNLTKLKLQVSSIVVEKDLPGSNSQWCKDIAESCSGYTAPDLYEFCVQSHPDSDNCSIHPAPQLFD